jgi:hypothetical protein
MKHLTCSKCQKEKEIIEFEYNYFKKNYDKVCKKCEDKHKKIFQNIK